MPIVTNKVVLPGGSLATRATVDIKLIVQGYVGSTDSTIESSWREVTGSDGLWSIDLTANSLIVPANTYYKVTESINGRVTATHDIVVPNSAGPHWVGDILRDPLAALPGSVLTEHIADSTGVHGITDTSQLMTLDTAQTVAGVKTFSGVLKADSNLQIKGPRPWVDVVAYGADPTGSAESSAAIQAAINALPSTGGESLGGVVFFPQGNYKVSSSIVLPELVANVHTSIEFLGYGATLTATTGIAIIGDTVPANQSVAVNRARRKFHFRGLRFEGNRTAGQKGLFLIGSYGSVIEDCTFASLDTGMDLVFCLMAAVKNCFGNSNKTDSFVMRHGQGMWTGASLSESCNGSYFEGCRDYGFTGQQSQFKIRASNGVELRNCITEGANPINAIDFDAENATTVKYWAVRNHHSENAPDGVVVRVKAQGRMMIDGLWHQSNSLMVDSTGSASDGLIVLSHCPWIPATPAFKADVSGARWHIEFPDSGGDLDPFETAVWSGGNRPTHRSAIRYNTNAEVPGTVGLLFSSGNQVAVKDEFRLLAGLREQLRINAVNGIARLDMYDGATLKHNQRLAGSNDYIWSYGATDLMIMTPAGHLSQQTGTIKTGRGTTAQRPSASTAGQGAQWFDTTLNKPIFSTGSAWVDAMGNAV